VATKTQTRPPAPPAPLAFVPGERLARSFFAGSIGTKVVVGVTGLLLLLYLVLHLAGNLLIYFGPATFNGYSHLLIKNPLVIPVEIGLAAVFVLHVYKAVTNWVANRRARPTGYYRSYRRLWGRGWGGPGSRKSIASSTMIVTGIVIFAFVLIHLAQFKYGPEYLVQEAMPGPGASVPETRDLYRLEMEVFGSLLNVAFYLVCMVVVGFHLWHGISSANQSLGADYPRWTPFVLAAGKVLALVIAGGFMTIPLWAYFFGGRG
jgi:succinate dehydrogenase / fumarate reductase cytochrome b subunit